MTWFGNRCTIFWGLALCAFAILVGIADAGEYLVGDRLLGRVLRYSDSGSFLGVLLDDPAGLGTGTAGGLSAITLSPNNSQLLVANRATNSVRVYSYNGTSATFSSAITAASASPSTISAPGGITFSPDASKLYVSNLGAAFNSTLVAQLTPAGASAGADLTGSLARGRSGMAFDPNGSLLVTSNGLFGGGGAVLRLESGSLVELVPHSALLTGAAALLVRGNDMYVAAGGSGRVAKYSFSGSTATLDASFGTGGYITNLAFPGSLALGPDNNSLLVGTLGASNGDSQILRFDLNGNPVNPVPFADDASAQNFPNFPSLSGGPVATTFGFSEPTALLRTTIIPEPTTLLLAVGSVMAGGMIRRRRR